jgi:hypothetical protein
MDDSMAKSASAISCVRLQAFVAAADRSCTAYLNVRDAVIFSVLNLDFETILKMSCTPCIGVLIGLASLGTAYAISGDCWFFFF